MELNHITEKKCNCCGATASLERRDRQHTNSLWNEVREFSCGKVVHFIPNYGEDSEPRVEEECPNTSSMILKKTQRSKFYEQLLAFIEKSKVDDEYKQNLLMNIKYV